MTNVKINDYCLMRCRKKLSDLGYSWCSEELLTEYHDKKYIINEVLICRQDYNRYTVNTKYSKCFNLTQSK